MVRQKIDKEDKENIVRKNLENIILYFLKKQPMCGYDIIKTVFQRFHVLISPGAVYPLLYYLKDKGVLKAEIEEGEKTKIYSLTKNGEKIIENRHIDIKKIF